MKPILGNTENPHRPVSEIHGQGHRRTTKNDGGDSGRKRGSGNPCSSEMAIEPPNHQGERAKRRNQGIIGGLHCEGKEAGTDTSEQWRNCCRGTIQSRTVHEGGRRQPLRPLLWMGPHREQVLHPSTQVRILRRTTPIEGAQMQRSQVHIETTDSTQLHARQMPELQRESYFIQWKLSEENRGHHNGATTQESATEWMRDEGGNGCQLSSAWHQAG